MDKMENKIKTPLHSDDALQEERQNALYHIMRRVEVQEKENMLTHNYLKLIIKETKKLIINK